ncbi:MAG: succinate dehydrogenase, cytochrome b556 subunit [Deltaproteobacteria bacterium]|nr:succinate dehydrogenase, cytochrome b556 subunit [Deltaproteobacteria bacterium]
MFKAKLVLAQEGLAGWLQGLLPSMRFFKPKVPYRWHWGFVAWLLHRLTGIALAGYIVLHLYVLQNLARGPKAFDSLMAAFNNPFFKVLEIGLLGVVVYHSLNGLRVVLMDYGPMANKESYRKWLAATFIVIAAIIVLGGLIMLGHIVAAAFK